MNNNIEGLALEDLGNGRVAVDFEELLKYRDRAIDLERRKSLSDRLTLYKQLRGALSRIGHEHENKGEGDILSSLDNANLILREHESYDEYEAWAMAGSPKTNDLGGFVRKFLDIS